VSWLDRVYTEPLTLGRAQDVVRRTGAENRTANGHPQLRCGFCGTWEFVHMLRLCPAGHVVCRHGESCIMCERAEAVEWAVPCESVPA
jgi:hypothetical protein